MNDLTQDTKLFWIRDNRHNMYTELLLIKKLSSILTKLQQRLKLNFNSSTTCVFTHDIIQVKLWYIQKSPFLILSTDINLSKGNVLPIWWFVYYMCGRNRHLDINAVTVAIFIDAACHLISGYWLFLLKAKTSCLLNICM